MPVEFRLSIYGSTALCWALAAFSAGLLGRGISPTQGRYLHRTAQTQNKRTQTSMSQVGFEPTIPVFERLKTVHALDRSDTVIGWVQTATLKKIVFHFSDPQVSDLKNSDVADVPDRSPCLSARHDALLTMLFT
jgi:hypothetical protein